MIPKPKSLTMKRLTTVKSDSVKNGMKKAERVTRKCVACGDIRPKSELFRIVRNREGEITVDLSGRADGRGAYLCRNVDCMRKAVSSRALNRSFKCEIDKELIENLFSELMK